METLLRHEDHRPPPMQASPRSFLQPALHLPRDSRISPPHGAARWPRRRRPARRLRRVTARHTGMHIVCLAVPPRGSPRFRPDMRLSPCVPRCAPPVRAVSTFRAVPLLGLRGRPRFSPSRSRAVERIWVRPGRVLATQVAGPGTGQAL